MRKIVFVVMFFFMAIQVNAQRINLKTNALYWMLESPNFGLEFRINQHITLNTEAMVSFLNINDIKVKGETFTPELRYWLKARPQAGHFIGLMGIAAHYDLQHKECHHNGDALGAGLTYGYSFVLGRRWSMEATAGVGLWKRKEKYYKNELQEPLLQPNNTKWEMSPLKAGVSFVYILK